MKRSVRHTALATAFAFVALAAAALGQVRTGGAAKPPILPPSHPIASPVAPPLQPGPVTLSNGAYIGAVRNGEKVPLSRLPHLPPRTMMNTLVPRETMHGQHYRLLGAAVFSPGVKGKHAINMHPNAASGATIEFWATAASCTTAGTVGALYSVGCALEWQPVNLNNFSSSDSYQTYYIASNSTNATAIGSNTAPAVADNGSMPAQTTTLNSAGTWTFGVYDTTTKQWVAVSYANAGSTFNIGVYQDPFHLTPSSQFDVSSSSNAYVYLTGLAPADYYVIYVTRTGQTPNCVFISPNSNPTPIPGPTPTGTAAALLCNPSNSTGNQAPNGNLSIVWPLNATMLAGSYSVAVYDCSAACNGGGVSGSLVGQTQVSLTGSSGITIITKPDGTNANSSPNPQPAATANTIVDWDGTSDQSNSGITGTAGSSVPLTSGDAYTWTLTDPEGQVVAIATPAALGAGVTSQTQTFQFASANLGFDQATAPNLPGTYPSSTWTMQIYDRTTKTPVASQSFEMLGYSSQTQFRYPAGTGAFGNSIGISTGTSTVADMRFTNTSNLIYPNAGDSLSKIVFSTGPNFLVSNSGNGVVAQLNGCGTSTCSGTATDSNGNTWNVNTSCSSTTSNNAECNVLLTPASAGVTLPPGAYVTVTSVNFTNTHGASGCGTACQGITSELPVNGLTWSGAPSSTTAWTPVYFAISPSDTGTASFRVVGSIDCTSGTRHLATPPPFVGTHCYQDRFAQADYQNNSPFSVTNSNLSIWSFAIANNAGSTNSISELQFQQPTTLYTQGGIAAVDTLSSANWQSTACPSGYGAQWYCIIGKSGHSIAAGGSETIYLDANWPSTSMAFTDFGILASQTPTVSDTFSLSAASGTDSTIDNLYSVDNLSIGAYSLNGNLMSTYFSPTSVGTGQTTTPLSIVFTNTSTSQDNNPDSVDAIIIQQSNSASWTVTGSPTVSQTGWSYLGTTNPSGSTLQYWFGLCGAQFVTTASPPPSQPTTVQGAMPECTLPESNSLQPGQSTTINMNVSNFGTPSSPVTFTMYAHGANGGGWSAAKTFRLVASGETASIAFTKVNGTAISNPTVPTVGAGPNTYVYEVKNTSASGSGSIGTVVITIPGTDISGSNATDSSGNTWTLTTPISSTITLSGSGSAGCTLNTSPAATFSASTSGTNGQITISGCTGLTAGNALDVTFQANNPQSQSDSYLFPATIDGSSTGAGALYLGSNEVQVAFSIGLSIAVDPSNPTSGNAHPVPACSPAQCAFSGTTLDFGTIGNSSSVTGTDVVNASVIYTGATSAGHTWTLSVQSNANPACTGGTCSGANEMLADVDSAASGSNANSCGAMTYNQTSLAVVPTASTMLIATGPENNCSKPYDVIQNYKVSIGTEAISGVVSTVTYTLIAN
jgi:hypothetical protein